MRASARASYYIHKHPSRRSPWPPGTRPQHHTTIAITANNPNNINYQTSKAQSLRQLPNIMPPKKGEGNQPDAEAEDPSRYALFSLIGIQRALPMLQPPPPPPPKASAPMTITTQIPLTAPPTPPQRSRSQSYSHSNNLPTHTRNDRIRTAPYHPPRTSPDVRLVMLHRSPPYTSTALTLPALTSACEVLRHLGTFISHRKLYWELARSAPADGQACDRWLVHLAATVEDDGGAAEDDDDDVAGLYFNDSFSRLRMKANPSGSHDSEGFGGLIKSINMGGDNSVRIIVLTPN
ncbi:hypothetical protein DFH27DRAFT_616377 [Peziza echinospora]|nr:hypothetical protein DFH27DRAFT_616377 [Peziza echinospora]